MIKIPEGLMGKKLFEFLITNKKALVAQKKSGLKYSEPLNFNPLFTYKTKKEDIGLKSYDNTIEEVDTETDNNLLVKVVCNSAWWCDNGMDVIIDTAYDKSIKEKGALIPHIADHEWKSTSHVGDVQAVYTQAINLSDLGLNIPGKTICAIMETNIIKDYNPLIYKFYKNGKINQHSIGYQIITMGLCVNDKEYVAENELWNKFYPKIINKDRIDKKGYFWVLTEIKWIENSCVLFGMNELTPTLDISESTSEKNIDTEQASLKSMPDLPPAKKKINFKSLI